MRRLATTCALVGLLILLGVIQLSTSERVAAAPAATQPAAITNLRTCISQTGRLDVLFLIDESGSLGGQGRDGTDLTAERVTGLRAALTGLERLTQASTNPSRVDVLMMGFSSTAETAPSFDGKANDPFQALSARTTPRLLSEAGAFTTRDTGAFTDYTAALTAARASLASEAASESVDGTAPCQAVVFFTDGEYDPSGNRAAGLEQLCGQEGVNDALRSDGVWLFTVALSSDLDSGDLAFLEGVTEGTGGTRCGTAASTANGYLVTASDVSSLAFLFGDLFTNNPTEPTALPGRFEIEPGVDGLLLRISVGTPGTGIVVIPPSGSTFRVKAGTAATGHVGGFDLMATSLSSSYVEISGQATDGGASGVWQVRAAGANSLYSVALSSSAKPSLIGLAPTVRPGSSINLPLSLELADGGNLTAGPLAAGARVDATLSENGTSTPVALPVRRTSSGFVASIAVPTTSDAAAYVVTAQAVLPTLDGIPVSAGSEIFQLARGLAAGPKLTTTSLAFGPLRGTSPSTGVLRFAGNAAVGGCVWLTDLKLQAPSAAGQLIVDARGPDSRADCLQVPHGAERTVQLTIQSSHAAFGRLTGSALVHILPLGAATAQTLRVPVTGRLVVPPNTARTIWIFVCLLVAGCLLPLLLLHFLNRRSAGFTPPTRLWQWDGNVLVDKSGVASVATPREPLALTLGGWPYADDGSTGGSELTPRMTISSIDFEAVPSGSWQDRSLRLFRGPYGTATATGLVAGSAQIRYGKAGRGPRTAVPLAIAGSWFFVPSGYDEAGGTTGALTLLLSDLATDDDLKSIIVGLSHLLPAVDFPKVERGSAAPSLDTNSIPSSADTLDDLI